MIFSWKLAALKMEHGPKFIQSLDLESVTWVSIRTVSMHWWNIWIQLNSKLVNANLQVRHPSPCGTIDVANHFRK